MLILNWTVDRYEAAWDAEDPQDFAVVKVNGTEVARTEVSIYSRYDSNDDLEEAAIELIRKVFNVPS